MKKFAITWLALMLTIVIYAEKREIHILAVNDMHAQIEVFPQLAALADSLRTIDPSLLILSAGDNRTGNPINDKYILPAYPMVALMNQVGFNGSTLGNHEFDVHSLKRLIGLSNFRYICANAFPYDSSGIKLVPYQMFDVEGLKVGVIGCIQTGPKGIPSTHPDNLDGISFKPAEEVVPQYEWLSKECDATILLSHLGYPDDIKMAEQFPWLDLIIGGHTHTQLKGNEVKNGVLITQNKNKLNRVTYITLTVEDGKVVDKKAEYIDVRKYPKTVRVVEEMLRFYNDNPTLRQILAVADTPFETREELGCMMCDAFMAETESEIGIENPGGVRIDSHPQGDITVRDVLEMDPFDNHAVVMELTGNEIARMMLSYSHNTLHSFPYVGGMTCEVTLEKDFPEKIKSIKLLTLDGKPLNMKKKYKVVTNSYIPATSDIPEGSDHMLNLETSDIIMQYLAKKKVVSYQGVSRLKIIQ
ncbi:MAG: 5'-nucleotidase C-terminal domain-containing protein [Prevotella sp.]|nr:5'-nucleotidase C-terminal domain-containing protein [Prevotella sp.]